MADRTLRRMVVALGVVSLMAAASQPPKRIPWSADHGDLRISMERKPGEHELGLWTLTLRRRGAKLWSSDVEYVPKGKALPSADGQWVALYRDQPEILFLGAKGEEVARWKPLDLLSPSEREQVPYTHAGPIWMTRARWVGEVLEVELPTQGIVPPIYEQPPGLTVRYDLRQRAASRPPPAKAEPISTLIERYRREPTRDALEALVRRSLDEAAPNEALARFWLDYLRAPRMAAERAVHGFSRVATEAQLEAALRLPAHPERDLAMMSVIDERLPAARPAFALQVMRERRAPETLRARAIVGYDRKGANTDHVEEVLTLGLADPSPRVREGAALLLPRHAPAPEVLDRLEPLLSAPEEQVRAAAATSLLEACRRAKVSEGSRLLAGLTRLDDRFAEGLFVLATAEHARGEKARALAAYLRAADALDRLEGRRSYSGRKLRVKALLQAALLAKDLGQGRDAEALARRVRAEKKERHTYVCAPHPDGEFAHLVMADPPCRKGRTAVGAVLGRAFPQAR